MAPLTTYTHSVLVNGVSQQPPLARLDSQCEEQINMISDVKGGVRRRPPSIQVAQVDSGSLAGQMVHKIDRSPTEQYIAVFPGDGTVKVFDKATGAAQTVNAIPAAAATYITVADPRKNLRALTLADNTIVTNKTVNTAMDGTTTADPVVQPALIWVRQNQVTSGQFWGIEMWGDFDGTGDPTANWTFFSNGAPFGITNLVITVDDKAPRAAAQINPSNTLSRAQIAGEIFTALEGARAADFTEINTNGKSETLGHWKSEWHPLWDSGGSGLNKETVLLEYLGPDTTKYSAVRWTGYDPFGGGGLNVAHVSTDSLSNLPAKGAPKGFKILISPDDPTEEPEGWYAEFDGSIWNESTGFGVETTFDGDTMPHALIRETNGTFSFGPISYDDRTVGDAKSVPTPSFIGKPIENLGLYKNRLAFLSGDGAVFSESGELFNFWQTTARQVLASDPIDTPAGSTASVPTFEAGLAWDKTFLLFASNNQAEVSGGTELFTAETVSTDGASDFAMDLTIPPIRTGNTLVYLSHPHRGSAFNEYKREPDGSYGSVDITAHIPNYLPSTINWADSSTEASIMVCGSDDTPNEMYVYKYFFSDGDKLQSSWSKWVHGYPGVQILSGAFFGPDLYLLTLREGKTHLEKIPLREGNYSTEIPHAVHLDARVEVAVGALVPGFNYTELTLPYESPPGLHGAAVKATGFPSDHGEEFGVITNVGTSVYVTSDLTNGTTVVFGYPMPSTWRPSQVTPRSPSRPDAPSQPVTNARVQVKRGQVELGPTRYARVEVTPNFAPQEVTTFDPGSVVDDQVIEFDVGAKAEDVTIDFTTDKSGPMEILEFSWEALVHKRSAGLGLR